MRCPSLCPRYLAKRSFLLFLFALLALLAGMAQDPRFFRALAGAAELWSISTEMLLVATFGILLAAFALIRTMLETRYALASQASGATALFLFVFTSASFIGFAIRLLFIPETSAGSTTAPPPVTFHQALIAIITLTFGASGAAAIYNLLFIQKADYAKFRAEMRSVNSLVTTMRSQYENHSYVSASHGVPLAQTCRKALDTLEELLKIESGAYAKFVEECVAQPLRQITNNISMDEAQQNPDSFLKDKKVIDALATLGKIG